VTDTALPGVIAKPIALLADDLRLTYANAAFAELFATPPLPLDALARAVQADVALQRAIAYVQGRLVAVGRTASFRWGTASAPSRTYQVHLARLPDEGILAVFDEISDAVLAEDIQSGARAYLEEVLNHLDRAVLVIDAGLRVTFMNVAQRELIARLGATAPWLEFVGQGVGDAYPILAPDAWRALCVEVVTCGVASPRQRVAVPSGASSWHLDIRVLPLGAAAGDTGGAVVISEDVTRLVALEAAALAREQRAWMAHVGVSLHHDVNNPLTTILGAAETLEHDERLDATTRARARAIAAAALAIADVVRRLAPVPAPPAVPRDPGHAAGAEPDR
jgi:nitrogen-specific signal transduction histidine kinase